MCVKRAVPPGMAVKYPRELQLINSYLAKGEFAD